MLDQLTLSHLLSTNTASQVGPTLVGIEMLLLICDLIKVLEATIDWALKRLLTCVDAHMVEQTLRFLEEFSTPLVIARVHSGLSLCIRVGLSDEFELGEETRARERQFLFED